VQSIERFGDVDDGEDTSMISFTSFEGCIKDFGIDLTSVFGCKALWSGVLNDAPFDSPVKS
jgi:hypothetical protein